MPSSHVAGVLALVVAVVVGSCLLRSEVDPQPLSLPPLRPLPDLSADGSTRLTVERLFEGEPGFQGPESFVFDGDGSAFTGLADGRIVRMRLDGAVPEVETVAHTGRDVVGCGTLAMEPVCGRPLGLRAERGGTLLVADAYLGLLRVDPRTGGVETLVGRDRHNLTLVNDVEVDAEHGVVYFTNTGRFPRNQIHRSLIEASPSGSVLAFHLQSGRVEVLAPNLVMPNGVALTHDGSALLVCTTVLSGIYRIELHGPARGQVRLVQNDLQGTPDNIRRHRAPTDGQPGTYLVALGSKRSLPFSLPQFLAPFSILRKLVGVLDLEMTTALIPRAGLVVEVDDGGHAVHFFQDPDLGAFWVSEAEVHGGFMYLGSWRTPFLARAPV